MSENEKKDLIKATSLNDDTNANEVLENENNEEIEAVDENLEAEVYEDVLVNAEDEENEVYEDVLINAETEEQEELETEEQEELETEDSFNEEDSIDEEIIETDEANEEIEEITELDNEEETTEETVELDNTEEIIEEANIESNEEELETIEAESENNEEQEIIDDEDVPLFVKLYDQKQEEQKPVNAIKEKDTKAKVGKVFKYIFVYLFLTICALVVLFPFYWMVLTSFKTVGSYNAETTPQFIPVVATMDNYTMVFKSSQLVRSILNTFIFSTISTAIMLIVCIFAAFAFARLNFRGKNLLFTLFLAMMMIPNELVIISNYTTLAMTGFSNTFVGLIAPSIMSVFYVYLLRQNFMQVPDSMYYAAKVDGVTDFKYLFKVLVPLSKPTIISIVILKFIECWNSYVWPNLIAKSENYYLISVAIRSLANSSDGRSNIPLMMAAVVVVSVPILLVFIIFRKQIMSGVSRTGTKG